MGELIKEAGLNTLLGMGMTFLVLITLSLIIALFGKVLNGGFKKEAAPSVSKTPSAPAEKKPAADAPKAEQTRQAAVDAAGTPEEDPALMAVIAAAVAAYEEGDVSSETAAVIAAAIAAYEEETGVELKPGISGFAVRKIRKSRKHVA